MDLTKFNLDWFKFNNLGLALGMALKFSISVAKGLKLKVKVLGAKSYVCRSYKGKTGCGAFLSLPTMNRVIMNKIKTIICKCFKNNVNTLKKKK